MDLKRYKSEMGRLKTQRQELERISQDLDRRAKQEEASRRALAHMVAFCSQVAQGIEQMTFEGRQQLLRLVVERITTENSQVKVETVISIGQDDGKLRNVRGEPVEP